MAKILFERTGGFMGRKISLEVDLQDLPKDQAEALEELLNDADFFELPEDLTSQDIPDGFTYLITAESQRGEHSVRCGDASTPDDLRPLVDELSRRARMQR